MAGHVLSSGTAATGGTTIKHFAHAACRVAPVSLAFADDVYLTDPSKCAEWLVEGAERDIEANNVLEPEGYYTNEWYCKWSPAIDFDPKEYATTPHVGFCGEPGPDYFPQVFLAEISPQYEPGIVELYSSKGDTLVFTQCTQ